MKLTTPRLFQAVLICALFALASRNVVDGDFWWHLRTGQYILATHSIPQTDIFSYTRAGQEWVTHEWLSQVMIAELAQLGGYAALIATFAGIIAASFFIAFRRCTGNLYAGAFVTLLGAFSTAALWDVRPQIIALLLTSGVLWALDRYRRQEQTRAVWLLIPLTIIWVNCHGSFALAPALVVLYLVVGLIEQRWWSDDETRPSLPALGRLALVLVLMLGAIMLNPRGARMYTYPFETLSSPAIQSQIAEWQTPDFHSLAVQPFLWLILATCFALALARRRPPLVHIALLVVSLYEALHAARFIAFFALVAIPVLSDALPIPAIPATRRLAGRWVLNWSLLGVLVIATLLYTADVVQNQPRTELESYPTKAVDYIQSAGLNEPIFNLYEWGGYLIYRLYPVQRVFIDGRSDLYGSLIDDYLTTYRAEPAWRTPLDHYRVGLVLIPPNAPLAALLAEDTNWHRVYQDAQAVIFVRK